MTTWQRERHPHPLTPSPWLLLVLLLLTACGGAGTGDGTGGEPQDGLLLADSGLGGDFTLTDHRDEPFRLAETDGRLRLLFFGFASCPDVCPQTLARIVRTRGLLDDAAEGILTIFVSVDPERDTPARLAEYLGYFDLGDAVAVTGSPEELAEIARSFGGFFERREVEGAMGYLVDHSAYVYLLDEKGEVRALFSFDETPETMAATIRRLQDLEGTSQ